MLKLKDSSFLFFLSFSNLHSREHKTFLRWWMTRMGMLGILVIQNVLLINKLLFGTLHSSDIFVQPHVFRDIDGIRGAKLIPPASHSVNIGCWPTAKIVLSKSTAVDECIMSSCTTNMYWYVAEEKIFSYNISKYFHVFSTIYQYYFKMNWLVTWNCILCISLSL